MTKRAFGNLELEILQLFTKDIKLSTKDVQQLLGGTDKYTTIMTVMGRLVEKKQLARHRVGLQYKYWRVQAPSMFEQIKKRLFGLKTGEVVSYLIESSDDISDKELKEIEELVKKARKRSKR